MNRQDSGLLAERVAACFLRLRGYSILATRYRFRGKEIDIVALHGSTVVFAEVKLRSSARRGPPRESVSARKQRHIASAARGFMAKHHMSDSRCRFDVVEIELREGGLALHARHLLGAFRPGRGGGECSRRF